MCTTFTINKKFWQEEKLRNQFFDICGGIKAGKAPRGANAVECPVRDVKAVVCQQTQ